MTFQRATARRIISLIRSIARRALVVGGYDPSLAPDAWTHPALGVDFIVRGEGELTFRELVRALEREAAVGIAGSGSATATFPPQAAAAGSGARGRRSQAAESRCARAVRLHDDGPPVDVVETSRGCTFDCSFCSIIEMRGRNFHRFPIDARDRRHPRRARRGARAIFFVDDNITIDVPRFEALCRAIIDARPERHRLHRAGDDLADCPHGETLAPLMQHAGFRYVFLGIENILDEDLVFLKATAKNSRQQRPSSATRRWPPIDILHRHGMLVVGGLIVGNPDDTRGVDRGEPGLRAAVRRLAVYPASDAVPRHADDARFPRRGLIVSRASTSTTAPRP